MSKKSLPETVELVRNYLNNDPENELHGISKILITESEAHIAMWQSLERHCFTSEDDLWVFAYLGTVNNASTFPKYYYLSAAERNQLSQDITNLTEQLMKIYVENKLDYRLVTLNRFNWNGTYILDDFDKWKFDLSEEEESTVTNINKLIEYSAKRALKKIEAANHAGKKSSRIKAIRLIRELHKHHESMFGKSLYEVLATVSNTIFDTNYVVADIAGLVQKVGNH